MRALASVLLPLLGLALILSGCGGRRPPPLVAIPARKDAPAPPGATSKPHPGGPAPLVRVLLRENFGSVRLDGSALAPSLVIQSDARGVRLLAKGHNRSASGFRLDAGSDGLVRLDGKTYRGAVEAFINPVGVPVIVNELSLEDYLKGVVANELNPLAFPELEALKVQAVAARSYALASLGQFARRGFDVYADERSQVYRGVNSERELSNRAVDETRGKVAVHGGKPILAYYSSTCGGRTEDYRLTFSPTFIPYLKGGVQCQDRSSRFYSWEERIPAARIQQQLDRLKPIGKLKKLVPLKRGVSGRIVEMRFVGSRGEMVLTGSNVRSVLTVRSSLIVDLDASQDSSGHLRELRVRGRGYGHGVGLCQIGAVELAEKGRSFERILRHYYPGIELVKWY